MVTTSFPPCFAMFRKRYIIPASKLDRFRSQLTVEPSTSFDGTQLQQPGVRLILVSSQADELNNVLIMQGSNELPDVKQYFLDQARLQQLQECLRLDNIAESDLHTSNQTRHEAHERNIEITSNSSGKVEKVTVLDEPSDRFNDSSVRSGAANEPSTAPNCPHRVAHSDPYSQHSISSQDERVPLDPSNLAPTSANPVNPRYQGIASSMTAAEESHSGRPMQEFCLPRIGNYSDSVSSPLLESYLPGNGDDEVPRDDRPPGLFDNLMFILLQREWKLIVLACTAATVITVGVIFSHVTFTPSNEANRSNTHLDRDLRVLQCAKQLSGSRNLTDHQWAAARWLAAGPGVNVELPETCSDWDTPFGTLYALVVIRELLQVTDASWHPIHALKIPYEFCKWKRITCDPIDNTYPKVTRLILNHAQLKGYMPPEIMGLQHLRTLDLNSNSDLVGTIPTEIGYLSNLEELLLHDSSISGTVPSTIGALKELRSLLLDETNLSGSMPSEICELRHNNLESLHASCRSSPNPAKIRCECPTCCTACHEE